MVIHHCYSNAYGMAKLVSLVFTSLMSVSRITREWSHALFTPVFKNVS